MRIAVNTRMLLKNRMEGVARYIYHTTKEMVLSHPEDDFYFFFDRPYDRSFIFAENVYPFHIGLPARHPFLFVLWFEISLRRAIKKHDIDVLYSGDSYMSLLSSVPTVIVSHDLAYIHYPSHIPFFDRLYYKLFFERFHKKAKNIIAVSNATKQDIIKQYSIDENKISIAYNDTDGSFKPLAYEHKKLVRKTYSNGKEYFLYLGSIHPRKNIANIIKAFSIFKDKHNTDHQFLFVGRKAWNNKNIIKTYNESKYKNEIHFLGMLEEGREVIMASAEALLYVSLFEGFGVPILEAMDSHTPVICSNLSSMPEVGGDAAILVNPNEPASIAGAMYNVISQKNQEEYLDNIGKHRSKFNWEDSAEIIYKTLSDAVEQ